MFWESNTESCLLQQENHPRVCKLHGNTERTAKEKQKFSWLGTYRLKVMFCKLTFEHSWIKWYLKQQTAAAMTDCIHLTNAHINNRGIKRVGVEAGVLRWTWATESFGGFVCWNWSGAVCEPQESDLTLSLFIAFFKCQNKIDIFIMRASLFSPSSEGCHRDCSRTVLTW